jgi:hypothetical protein
MGRQARRWMAPALIAASVAVPAVSSLSAKDKPAKGQTESVAKKIDDSTRLGSEKGNKHALSQALEAARTAREKARELPGYSSTFIKQELTPKKGMIRQVMAIKFRREPFSVYLKFIEPHEGREVIYVDGKNKNRMQVHEPSGIVSLAGTLSINPVGDEAMKENRYPIMNFGMEKLMDAVIVQWEGELKHPETEVKHYPNAKIGNTECEMFESVHSKERPHFKFKTTRLYIDKKSGLPIRIEQFGFPTKAGEEAPLIEEYNYTSVKVESKLTDLDFDVKNDAYGFK